MSNTLPGIQKTNQTNLVEILREPLDGTLSEQTEEKIINLFKKIADELFNHYYIVKNGDDEITPRTVYHFMELEFYYCTPEHPDLITYPREAKAGDWFFHSSGVDICFESHIHPNQQEEKDIQSHKCYGFGGILIRALSKRIGESEPTYITGPLKCCYELFDRFSAFTTPINFPKIEKSSELMNPSVQSCGRLFRFNTSLKNKLDGIKREYMIKNIQIAEQSEETFMNYLKKSYCFFDANAFENFSRSKGKRYDVPSTYAERLREKKK